jgi:AcrR family transcriptional regulator
VRATTHPLELRTRVLDAADRLLARYGYRKMTVDDIAAEAGIGKGSVYLAFASKEEVALSCIDRMVDGLLAELRAIASESRPHLERLRKMLILRVMHRVDYARTHAGSMDAMLAAVRPAFLARRERHFAAEVEVLSALLEAARRAGAARAVEARSAAVALVTATNALLPYSLSVAELGRRAEIERRTGALAELLVQGIAASPRSRRSTSSHRTPSRRIP